MLQQINTDTLPGIAMILFIIGLVIIVSWALYKAVKDHEKRTKTVMELDELTHDHCALSERLKYLHLQAYRVKEDQTLSQEQKKERINQIIRSTQLIGLHQKEISNRIEQLKGGK